MADFVRNSGRIAPEYAESHDADISGSNVGVQFRHFLPFRLVQKYDVTLYELNQYLLGLCARDANASRRRSLVKSFANFMKTRMFGGSDQLPQGIIERTNKFLHVLFESDEMFTGTTTTEYANFVRRVGPKVSSTASPFPVSTLFQVILQSTVGYSDRNWGIRATPLPDLMRVATAEIIEFFSNKIRYLGPLRDDPRVIYALPPIPDVPDVGVKGQYTAVVLDRNKDVRVEYVDPSTRKNAEIPLLSAVIAWLKHMGMLESVSTREEGKLGFRLSVRSPAVSRDLDLTTVGVGVSQVLPILVMALLAPRGTLLIFEQPEIHLHPKVQSLLGDFFLSMGKVGKQCLVETHSEYLVNRLRLRIAEADGGDVMKMVGLYFVEKEGSFSQFRAVQPNEYGAVMDWPVGFFDEGPLQSEELVRLATIKRRKNTLKP